MPPIDKLKDGSKKAIETVADIDEVRKAYVFRSLVWLMKVGILKLS